MQAAVGVLPLYVNRALRMAKIPSLVAENPHHDSDRFFGHSRVRYCETLRMGCRLSRIAGGHFSRSSQSTRTGQGSCGHHEARKPV